MIPCVVARVVNQTKIWRGWLGIRRAFQGKFPQTVFGRPLSCTKEFFGKIWFKNKILFIRCFPCWSSWLTRNHVYNICREIALEILVQQEIGSFIIRDSTTHPGCFALSVKVPKFENPTGISHYLIHRTKSGNFKLKVISSLLFVLDSLSDIDHIFFMRTTKSFPPLACENWFGENIVAQYFGLEKWNNVNVQWLSITATFSLSGVGQRVVILARAGDASHRDARDAALYPATASQLL